MIFFVCEATILSMIYYGIKVNYKGACQMYPIIHPKCRSIYCQVIISELLIIFVFLLILFYIFQFYVMTM